MAPNPESTRRLLVAAAEQLFAERGIEGVSLREINAAAGMRNATALQYHFHDRYGLVKAVLAKHVPAVDAMRHEMLDEYAARGDDDLRALAAALVRPSASKLADPDGGRAYLRIHAEVLNRPDVPAFDESKASPKDSIHRWRALVAPLLPDVAVRRLHHRFTAMRVSAVELARRAAAAPRRDDQLFVSHLTDLVAAVLATEISPETEGLLRARESRTVAGASRELR